MVPGFFLFRLAMVFSHLTSSEKRLKENGDLDVLLTCLFCLFMFVDAFTVAITVLFSCLFCLFMFVDAFTIAITVFFRVYFACSCLLTHLQSLLRYFFFRVCFACSCLLTHLQSLLRYFSCLFCLFMFVDAFTIAITVFFRVYFACSCLLTHLQSLLRYFFVFILPVHVC